MDPTIFTLNDGSTLLIREATPEDAASLLDYVEQVSGESDFLMFGPGEFELTIAQEEAYLAACLASDRDLYLLGIIDGAIVAALTFTSGRRPRVRHCGEFGMSVRRKWWGHGIGSLMVDALIAWAKTTGSIRKIDLQVRTDNERAVQLYEKKGFVCEGRIARQICLNTEYFDLYWMGREL